MAEVPAVSVSPTWGVPLTVGRPLGGLLTAVLEDESPFSMVPVPVASSSVAWLGLDRVRVRVSWPSSSESARTVTSTVWDRSPALKVSVALVAV